MPPLNNTQHEKFVQELVKGKNQADAYLGAGYKAKSTGVASAAATRLLKEPAIQERIAELQAKAAEKTVLSKQWVIDKLIANVERSMQAAPVVDAKGIPTGEYTYQGNVANKALELLGKEQGMFIDRKEVGRPGSFEELTDEELQEAIVEQTKELADLDPEFAAQLALQQATKH